MVVELETTLEHVTPIVLLSYVLRVTLLFYIGAMWAYLNKGEKSPLKLFQLGIVAPALITILINANNVHKNTDKAVSEAIAQNTRYISLIPSVYAQSSSKIGTSAVKTYTLPKETWSEQFKRGLTGAQNQRIWFVVVGACSGDSALDQAQRQVQQLRQRQSIFTYEVYNARPDGDSNYDIVIGINLTFSQANQLKNKAAAVGLRPSLKNPFQ